MVRAVESKHLVEVVKVSVQFFAPFPISTIGSQLFSPFPFNFCFRNYEVSELAKWAIPNLED
ncbi:hypothetical protein LguiB_011869 [Lonicera macranthoides]